MINEEEIKALKDTVTIHDVVKHLDIKVNSNQLRCPSPEHHDSTPSATIYDNGKTCYCHGCDNTWDVIGFIQNHQAITFQEAVDLMRIIRSKKSQNGNDFIPYVYNDSNGRPAYRMVRTPAKGFFAEHPRADGSWGPGLNGARTCLYTPVLISEGDDVIFCEGEKDCDRLISLGLKAVTNPFGAGKITTAMASDIPACHLVVVPDNDEAGEKHAEKVIAVLGDKMLSIKVVNLPGLDEGGDVSDWLDAGHDISELKTIIEATPCIDPADADDIARADKKGGSLPGKIYKAQKKQGPRAQKDAKILNLALKNLNSIGSLHIDRDDPGHHSVYFINNNTGQAHRVNSDEFQSWLSNDTGVNRATQDFTKIIKAIQDAGMLSDHLEVSLFKLWGQQNNAVYISNGPTKLVKITADSVEELPNGSDGVVFLAQDTLAPWRLTNALDVFESCKVFNSAAYTDNHGWLIFKAWVISMIYGLKWIPPLALIGAIGSGKTRVFRGIYELLGVDDRLLGMDKLNQDEFWVSTNRGGLMILDNIDSDIAWLPDAISTAVTGGSYERRRLYTDDQVIKLRSHSAIGITSSAPAFASDAGLSDRLIVLRTSRRTSTAPDSELTRELLQSRDQGLSHICSILSKVLADNEPIPGNINKRHPDWANLLVKIGRAINREADVINALKVTERQKIESFTENNPMANAIFSHLPDEGLEGTAAEILKALKRWDCNTFEDRRWTPRRVGRLLPNALALLTDTIVLKELPMQSGTRRYKITRTPITVGSSQ